MSKGNQYDLNDVANALSILMTSDKTPLSIHDSIVDRLADLESNWAKKHINDYDPQHLADVLALELGNEQESEQATETEDASDTEDEEDADEPFENKWLKLQEIDVFAHVLSVLLKENIVSDEIKTHFGDALTQLENDHRNESTDYDSEEHIRSFMRGYFGYEGEESAAA